MRNSFILLPICLILFSCSRHPQTAPDVPPDPVDPSELAGAWTLVSAEHVFEGDLFITKDGKGVEYTASGSIQRTEYDFTKIECELKDNSLTFLDRAYTRRTEYPVESPCDYYPDEGMVKIFIINGSLPLTVRVLKSDIDGVFIERHSVWSRDIGFETVEYKLVVEPTNIHIYGEDQVNSGTWRYSSAVWLRDTRHFENFWPGFPYIEDVRSAISYSPADAKFLTTWHISYDADVPGDLCGTCSPLSPYIYIHERHWLGVLNYVNMIAAEWNMNLGISRMQFSGFDMGAYDDALWYPYEWNNPNSVINLELIEHFNPVQTDEFKAAWRDYLAKSN
ncbi:hypothetical protein ACFLQV_04115 [Calditrichota bacterium]